MRCQWFLMKTKDRGAELSAERGGSGRVGAGEHSVGLLWQFYSPGTMGRAPAPTSPIPAAPPAPAPARPGPAPRPRTPPGHPRQKKRLFSKTKALPSSTHCASLGLRAPSSNGKVIGSGRRRAAGLPRRVIKTFFFPRSCPSMTRHSGPLPRSHLTSSLFYLEKNRFFPPFLRVSVANPSVAFPGRRFWVLSAPGCRRELARAGSLLIFKGESWADVIGDSLYKSEPRLIQKICRFCNSSEPHNVIVLLICGHLDNMTVPRW